MLHVCGVDLAWDTDRADIESLHVGQMWARQGAGFLVLGHLFRAMMG